MAQSKLTWKNIAVSDMASDERALFMAYHKAHDALEAWYVADARKHKQLQDGQTVKLSIRQDVIGFAIANGSATHTVTAKNRWA